MSSQAVRDISVGNPSQVLLRFSLPLVLSGVFQQLYNIADSVVVGKFVGDNALAAVGASYPIVMLFVALAMGSTTGSSVIISMYFGAKRWEEMKTSVSTVYLAAAILSAVCMAAGMLLCAPLMRLMNVPAEIFDQSLLYLRIYFLGLFFLFFYNSATSIFNGLGNSRTPLYFLIFSSLFNVALDILLVAAFDLGVAGVAWATFIAQGISAALAMCYLFAKLKGIPAGPHPRFSLPILKKISVLAIPNMLNMSTVSIGQLLIQVLVNSYGPVVIAAYSSAIKIDSLFKIVISSLSNAMTTFTAQNIGAKKLERIDVGRKALCKVSILYAAASYAFLFFLAPQVMSLFVQDASNQVVTIGTEYLREVAAFYLVFAFYMIHTGVLKGAGHVRAFLSIILIDLGLRVSFSYLLGSLQIGYSAIWWSIPIGWGVAMCIAIPLYRKGGWRKVNLIQH